MSCPYGTYQRALASHGLSIPRAVVNQHAFKEAMLSRLSAKGKADPKFVDQFIKGAYKHLMNDYQIMIEFRF
jgi:hypothetical protein